MTGSGKIYVIASLSLSCILLAWSSSEKTSQQDAVIHDEVTQGPTGKHKKDFLTNAASAESVLTKSDPITITTSQSSDQDSIISLSLIKYEEEQVPYTWQTRDYLFADPNYFHSIHALSPQIERILSHRAYMTGRQMDSDEAKKIVDSDVEFSFILVLGVVCPDCAKGVIFYEKSISGRPMSVDEYEELLDQPNFGQIIESAKADDYVVGLFQ